VCRRAGGVNLCDLGVFTRLDIVEVFYLPIVEIVGILPNMEQIA
jgi:hypothetical protein